MRIRWYGQSAFLLTGEKRVFIDPFGEMGGLSSRGMQFDYPPIAGVEADLVLLTHDHRDHNAAHLIGGSPVVLGPAAGRNESPAGEVVGIASEHDEAAGTKRGPNTIFCFTLDGVRICHMGDFGQPALRPEQREAIGDVDLLMVPVGGGPTIGDGAAADVVRAIGPHLVVPMHYATPAVNFLEPPDAFLEALNAPVTRLDASEMTVDGVPADGPQVTLLAAPGR
jgi:L-ascorbate metabolism protein UlaG (beta-lactamase superfamily)